MDTLTLNFDALQRLSEALPKKGASLTESQSLFEWGKGLADEIEESTPEIDRGISLIRTNWSSLSSEDIESLKSTAERTQKTLERIEENDLLVRLLLLIPSIRRRKNLYKLLREPNERLVSTIATVISAWEEQQATASDLEFERTMEASRKVSSKYRNALRELSQ